MKFFLLPNHWRERNIKRIKKPKKVLLVKDCCFKAGQKRTDELKRFPEMNTTPSKKNKRRIRSNSLDKYCALSLGKKKPQRQAVFIATFNIINKVIVFYYFILIRLQCKNWLKCSHIDNHEKINYFWITWFLPVFMNTYNAFPWTIISMLILLFLIVNYFSKLNPFVFIQQQTLHCRNKLHWTRLLTIKGIRLKIICHWHSTVLQRNLIILKK